MEMVTVITETMAEMEIKATSDNTSVGSEKAGFKSGFFVC